MSSKTQLERIESMGGTRRPPSIDAAADRMLPAPHRVAHFHVDVRSGPGADVPRFDHYARDRQEARRLAAVVADDGFWARIRRCNRLCPPPEVY